MYEQFLGKDVFIIQDGEITVGTLQIVYSQVTATEKGLTFSTHSLRSSTSVQSDLSENVISSPVLV